MLDLEDFILEINAALSQNDDTETADKIASLFEDTGDE